MDAGNANDGRSCSASPVAHAAPRNDRRVCFIIPRSRTSPRATAACLVSEYSKVLQVTPQLDHCSFRSHILPFLEWGSPLVESRFDVAVKLPSIVTRPAQLCKRSMDILAPSRRRMSKRIEMVIASALMEFYFEHLAKTDLPLPVRWVRWYTRWVMSIRLVSHSNRSRFNRRDFLKAAGSAAILPAILPPLRRAELGTFCQQSHQSRCDRHGLAGARQYQVLFGVG